MSSNVNTPLQPTEVSTFPDTSYVAGASQPKIGPESIVFTSDEGEFSMLVRNQLDRLQKVPGCGFVDLGISDGNHSQGFECSLRIHLTSTGKSLKNLKLLQLPAVVAHHSLQSYNVPSTINIAHQRQMPKGQQYNISGESTPTNYSLGQMRSQPYMLEPILRDTSQLIFHLGAVRAADAPGLESSLPTGLQAEEACQLMRYAGESDQLGFIYINTGDITTSHHTTAMLVAQIIWYTIEGRSLRVVSSPLSHEKDYTQYLVETSSGTLQFYRRNIDDRWSVKALSVEGKFIACAHEEYQSAVQGSLSNRLLYSL